MALNFKTPGGDRTLIAALLTIAPLFVFVKDLFTGRELSGTLMFLTPMIGLGVGLWFKRPWARWLTVLALVLLAARNGYLLLTLGFSWMRLIGSLGSAYTAYLVWKHFSPAAIAADEEEEKPMISLVLLLKDPRYLEASILANVVSSAWGEEYSAAGDGDTGRFVVGESPLFLIHGPQGVFAVNNFSAPYFNNMEKLVEEVRELRLRKALEEHTAWLSVDLIRLTDESVPRESAYQAIGKLISELSGAGCLAILHPGSSAINVWDAELAEKLRGADVMEVFAESTGLPVVQVADDDPRMVAAVAQARSTWPEFVEAFKKRDGENFAIKAPITVNERTEFIWIEVDGLEPEYIHGTLANDPVDLGNLKLGSRVEVPLKELNDWGFIRHNEPVGMFTVKVLQEIYGKK